MAETAYYKVLDRGRSCNGDLAWSLPAGGTPGGWHEVEGPLVQCKNGLHLTSWPESRGGFGRGGEVYLAEYEGETLGPFGDELVCRKVRLLKRVTERDRVSPEELAREREQRAAKKAERDKEKAERLARDSPAYTLLSHVWKGTAKGSWRRLNDAMGQAARLAVVGGFGFNPDDFKRFAKDFNSGYWIGDGEQLYALACGSRSEAHGGNPSAVQAFEAWKGRKPFTVLESARADAKKVRLHVGCQFGWHVDLRQRVNVKVTSFNDKTGTLVACSYKSVKVEGERWERSEVDRKFRISHDDIAEYHKAVRDAAKKPAADASEVA